MRATVIKLNIVLSVLGGSTSAETSFEEHCPYDYRDDNCEYAGFNDSSRINCTEGKICVTNGCYKECREPVLNPDYIDGCYHYYTYEEICPENQFCCYDDCYKCFELPEEIGDSTYNVTDMGCCYSLWEIFPYSPSCEPGLKCIIDGCHVECKEAVFSDGYCSYSYTSEDNCAENEFCCWQNCTYKCKKVITLEEGSTIDITGGGCCFSAFIFEDEDYEADCSEGKTCTLNGCQKKCRESVVDKKIFTYDVTGKGCCYSGLLWELTSSSYYSKVDCEREKICVINGCRRECMESYDDDYNYEYVDKYLVEGCFSSYSYEDICEKNEFCCLDNCSYICKPKKTIEAGSTTDITTYESCYSSLIYEYSMVNCSEMKTCVINGCQKTCREPVPSEGGCYYNYTNEETCQNGQFCCYENYSSHCKDLPKDLENCTEPINPLCKCYYNYSYVEECPTNEFCCWDQGCIGKCKPEIILKANTTTDVSDLGCCYSKLIYDYDEIDCSVGETCVIDGCQKICREPVLNEGGCYYAYTYEDTCTDDQFCCSDRENCTSKCVDIPKDPIIEEECYYNYTYEDTCPDDKICCKAEECSFVCKDPHYRTEGCPDLSSYKPNWWEYSYDYVTLCNKDHECDDGELCCPTNCSLFENICSYPVNRRATCPDLKISGETTDPGLTPCESNSTCIEMDLLCCRLYSDKEETYCTEPIYVDDPGQIILF